MAKPPWTEHATPESHDPPVYRPPDPQPPGPPYAPPPVHRPEPSTNVKAVLALVFAIAGIAALPFVGSVLGVVFGHLARKEIAADPSQTGDSLALIGIILGWVMLGLLALVIAIVVIVVLVAAIVFLIALIVHVIVDDEEEEGPSFPWPFQTDVRSRPLAVS